MSHPYHESETAKEQRALNERIAFVVDDLKELSTIAAERFQDARKLLGDLAINPTLAGVANAARTHQRDFERSVATVDAQIKAVVTSLHQVAQSVQLANTRDPRVSGNFPADLKAPSAA